MKKSLGVCVLGAVAVVVGAGCEPDVTVKVTAGGQIPGAFGGSAVLTAQGNSCKGDAKGTFTYKDASAGISLKGKVTEAFSCEANPYNCWPCVEGAGGWTNVYFVLGTWTSTTKPVTSGTASICLTDGGEGNASLGDGVAVALWNGGTDPQNSPPSYTNAGVLQGNVQAHEDQCK